MKKSILLITTILSGYLANAQVAQQGFETTGGTWSFTASPAKYNLISSEDIWTDTTYLGNTSSSNIPVTSAPEGSRFWGMWDLQNPYTQNTLNLPSPYYHYLDFATITLNTATSYSFKFKYFQHIVGGTGDSVGYVMETNNGTTWNMNNFVLLPYNGTWDSVSVNVPANSQYVRVRFAARINGGDDWTALDDVKLIAGATVTPPSISIINEFMSFDEAADTVLIPVTIQNRDTANSTSFNVSLVAGFGTTSSSDFTIINPTIQFGAGVPDTTYIKIKITNDAAAENTEYFGLMLSNITNGGAGANDKTTIYIKDNDYSAPTAVKNIELQHLGSYQVPGTGSSAEISAYDSASNRLFVVNSTNNILHILSFANPAALTEIDTVDFSQYGGGINSVAAHNGIIAVAVQANPKTDLGKVVFFDTAGTFLKEVAAGALPDMVCFTHNGKYVLTANEGEPNNDYSVDPEGSVTVIDIQNGVASATATNVTFSSYIGQETALRSQGIRIYGPGANAAQDFEPEYITVSANNDTAWITLQENNAVAVLDIATKTIVKLLPLGAADFSQAANPIDASDKSGEVLIANWPVKGLYLPDALASFSVSNQTYLVTANEGDAREYDTFVEEERIKSSAYPLDTTVFAPTVASLLKKDHNLGRLTAITSLGDTDNDGDFDEIYVLGSRSFSIWNATTGAQVYNSGADFEHITAADPKFGAIFNASNDGNDAKNRSDNKGPEPEGVATGKINDTTYAFITLERVGGVMVYNVSNPANPVFVQYINTRDTASFGGDNGPEGIIFLKSDKNPLGKHYLITSNEISGTIAVFEVKAATIGVNEVIAKAKDWNVYPNPVSTGTLYFSQEVTGRLTDISGRAIATFAHTSHINTSSISAGVYFIQVDGFVTKKIIIE